MIHQPARSGSFLRVARRARELAPRARALLLRSVGVVGALGLGLAGAVWLTLAVADLIGGSP